MATVISDVATGLRIKGAEKLEETCRCSGRRLLNGIADVKLEAAAKPVKSEVDDRGGIEGQQLAENQAANDGDAEWTAQLGTDAGSERKRQTAEQRGHRGHHDGPETQQAGFVNGVERRLAFLAFSFEREVNHHDGVFLDDADQQDDANERDDAKFRATKQEGKDGADSGGRKRGKNRNRMDVAFVQNAENNVNGDDRSQYQDGLIGKRPEEGGRGALECTLNAGRHVQFLLGTIHGVDGIAERRTRSEVEGNRHDRKLALMV